MDCFDHAVDYVLRNEDGLNENKNDRGGITNHGISLRFLKSIPSKRLRNYGIFTDQVCEDDIRNLTLEQAKNIYRGEFWDHAPFDEIRSQRIINFMFDMAVNMGISAAIKCAQRAVWAVMKKRLILIDDGILGAETLQMINQCSLVILPAMRSERAGYHRLDVERHPDQEVNLKGWLNRAYSE